MIICKITTELEASDLRELLSHYLVPSCSNHSISFDVPISLQDLEIKVVKQEDIHFYTNDLRAALDKATNGLFTYLYGEHEIVGCIYYSRASTIVDMRFEVHDMEEDNQQYIEDLIIPSDDIEYLYDCLEVFSQKNGIILPYPRRTKFERMRYELHSTFFTDVLTDFHRSSFGTIEKIYTKFEGEICRYVMEHMDSDSCELIPSGLVSEAFWNTILQHILSTTTSASR